MSPSLQRKNDTVLIENKEIIAIHHCRLYFNVFFLSDITTSDSKHIDPNILDGKKQVDRTRAIGYGLGKNLQTKNHGIYSRNALNYYRPKMTFSPVSPPLSDYGYLTHISYSLIFILPLRINFSSEWR